MEGSVVGVPRDRKRVAAKAEFVQANTEGAWATLFIPIILGGTANVISRCETTGEAVELLVWPEGVRSANPATIHLSFVLPEGGFDQRVVSSFCHYVHFFTSFAIASLQRSGSERMPIRSCSHTRLVG